MYDHFGDHFDQVNIFDQAMCEHFKNIFLSNNAG